MTAFHSIQLILAVASCSGESIIETTIAEATNNCKPYRGYLRLDDKGIALEPIIVRYNSYRGWQNAKGMLADR